MKSTPFRAILLLAVGCGDPRQVVTLADSVVVQAGIQLELRAPEPLNTPARSGFGDVCMTLLSPLTQDSTGFAIRAGTADRVVPVVAAVRADGHADTLGNGYYSGS